MKTSSRTITQSTYITRWTWLVVLLGWRAGLAIVASLAFLLAKYAPTFPYYDSLLPSYGLPSSWYSWANFDGVHYLTIVSKGYVGTGLIQAFFPLYPLLVWVVTLVTNNALVSGLVVSHLALITAAWVTWQWWRLDQPSETTTWSYLTWLTFPTSFYLVGLYTESLFWLLIALSWWMARQKKWGWAGVAAALASATRIVGVWLVPALVVEWLVGDGQWLPQQWWQPARWPQVRKAWQHRWQTLPNKLGTSLALSLGLVGLLAYMAYLQITFHDPLYFLHVQAEFGSGRQENLVLLPQVLWRAIKIVATYQTWDWRYWAYVQELTLTVLVGLGLMWATVRQRWGYMVFATLAFITPTLTGTLSSMPRYVLSCFPFFLLMGEWLVTHRWWRWFYLVGSMIALIINVMLFIQGYWIA